MANVSGTLAVTADFGCGLVADLLEDLGRGRDEACGEEEEEAFFNIFRLRCTIQDILSKINHPTGSPSHPPSQTSCSSPCCY